MSARTFLQPERRIYLGLVCLNYCASILFSLICMAVLTPSELGRLTLARVFVNLTEYGHLGTRFSIDKYKGEAFGDKLHDYVGSVNLVSLASLAFLLVGVWLSQSEPRLTLQLLVWGGALAIATNIKSFYRIQDRWKEAASQYFIAPVMLMFACGIATVLAGLEGLGWTAFIASTAFIVGRYKYILYCPAILWRLLADRPTKWMFGVSLVSFALLNMEKLYVAAFYKYADLGYLTVCIFGYSTVSLVPSAIAEFSFKSLAQATGTPHLDEAIKNVSKTLLLSSIFAAAVVVAGFSLAPQIINEQYSTLTPYFILFALIAVVQSPQAALNQVANVLGVFHKLIHLHLAAGLLCFSVLLTTMPAGIYDLLLLLAATRFCFVVFTLIATWIVIKRHTRSANVGN